MNIQEQEERDFVVATDADWDRAEAYDLGAANPEQAWVCTDPDCGFNLRIDNGEISIGRTIGFSTK